MTDNRTGATILPKITIKTNLTSEELFASAVREMLWKAVDMFNLGDDFIDQVDIRFTIKGRTAGKAGKERGRYYLDFNREAIRDHWDEMLKVTIPHEVAHIVAYAKPALRAKGHNKYWRKIDLMLGGDGTRTHTMGLSRARKTMWYVYEVPGVGRVELGAVRHNRLMRGKQTYHMKTPGGNIDIREEHYTGERFERS